MALTPLMASRGMGRAVLSVTGLSPGTARPAPRLSDQPALRGAYLRLRLGAAPAAAAPDLAPLHRPARHPRHPACLPRFAVHPPQLTAGEPVPLRLRYLHAGLTVLPGWPASTASPAPAGTAPSSPAPAPPAPPAAPTAPARGPSSLTMVSP